MSAETKKGFIISELKDAAGKIDVNADMSAITSEKTDAFYDGDASKWIKYANSLRLRYAMRLSAVDQAKDFWDFVNNDSYLLRMPLRRIILLLRKMKLLRCKKKAVGLILMV